MPTPQRINLGQRTEKNGTPTVAHAHELLDLFPQLTDLKVICDLQICRFCTRKRWDIASCGLSLHDCCTL